MRRIIATVSVLLLAASVTLAVSRQATDKPAQKTAKVYTGTVASVDADAKQITIKDKTGADVSLVISEDTKISKDGKAATLADIKVGDNVTSECEESADGRKVKSIQVKTQK